jgi:hypothetical protein
VATAFGSRGAVDAEGARAIDYYGYSGCIALENATTRVVLGHHAGGRVLEYALHGENALYLAPDQSGWVHREGEPAIHISAGRCDIGPEHVIPRHPTLWLGAWTAEITGARSARMVSQDDPETGVCLTRDFELDAATSRLRFTQTQTNVSGRTTEWCHWSRTFARHGGIGVVPLSERPMSRFPKGYVMYGSAGPGIGAAVGFRPEDPQITRRSDGGREYLVIRGVPQQAKLGFDSYAGWFAYLEPHGVAFVKRFASDPNRVYNEVAAITSCIYYPKERFVELEPIGPRETLAPGESASFTEEWELVPFAFPAAGEEPDLATLAALAERHAG